MYETVVISDWYNTPTDNTTDIYEVVPIYCPLQDTTTTNKFWRYCPKCGWIWANALWKYCPYCGSRLDEDC